MLRKGWVDCEGWDWLSIRRGDHLRRGSGVIVGPRKPSPRAASDVDEERDLALSMIRESIAEGNGVQALALLRDAVASTGAWELGEPELRGIALLIAKSGDWPAAAPLLEEHHRRFPGRSPVVAIRLAEHYSVRGARPTRAKQILEAIDTSRLSPAATLERDRLLRFCQERIDSGALEFFD
jgi:hypothetical protein